MTSTLVILCSLAALQAAEPREPVVLFQALDNGDASDVSPDPRPGGVPWWRASGEQRTGTEERAGERWLATPAGSGLDQPFAAFAPTLARDGGEGFLVRGNIAGEGTLTLVAGDGQRLARRVGGPQASPQAPQRFTWRADELPPGFLKPRLTLELASATERNALWGDLEVLVPLPRPTRAELRAEIVAYLDEIFRTYVTRSSDDLGERTTGFIFVKPFDIVTGEPIYSPIHGSINQVCESLLAAVATHDHPDWRRWLDGFLADYLALAFHPTTGLPQKYDAVNDVALTDLPVEIARDFAFLLDVYEHGPEAHRELALQRAEHLAETVLAHGVLPDGSIAVKYVPGDASPRLDVISLRCLNVAALLTRLGALNGDARMLDAALVAVGLLEYTLYWGGSWSEIDPDFDDSFGNWGARAVDMLASYPDEEVFRRFVHRGFAHFAPLWADSLRFGGSTAADQVRCWQLLGNYAQLSDDAPTRDRIQQLLRAAVRVHFKGEQYGNGAWGDITVSNFDPKPGLNVGDLDGAPQNLLEGLAYVYGRTERGTTESDELLAMFTAVLRSSASAYRRPYGWLRTRYQLDTLNLPGGEQRMLPGMLAMLEHLRD